MLTWCLVKRLRVWFLKIIIVIRIIIIIVVIIITIIIFIIINAIITNTTTTASATTTTTTSSITSVPTCIISPYLIILPLNLSCSAALSLFSVSASFWEENDQTSDFCLEFIENYVSVKLVIHSEIYYILRSVTENIRGLPTMRHWTCVCARVERHWYKNIWKIQRRNFDLRWNSDPRPPYH